MNQKGLIQPANQPCGCASHLSAMLMVHGPASVISIASSCLLAQVVTPWPQMAIILGFHLLQQDLVYCLVPEVPSRVMLKGPRISSIAGHVHLSLYPVLPSKKSLCQTSSWQDDEQISPLVKYLTTFSAIFNCQFLRYFELTKMD